MLSLIDVKCPHCDAQGQIMLPPLGAIIIGPCPECQGMVAVFCGRVLALDSEMMNEGTTEEKREHVSAVLGTFIDKRVERLFSGAEAAEAEDGAEPNGDGQSPLEVTNTGAQDPASPISPAELESFVNVDLRLLDNPEYFKAIFPEN